MPNPIKPSDVDIELSLKFDVKGIIDMKKALAKAIRFGMLEFKAHFEDLVMVPLVFGGSGWKSVEQTAAWKWINSPAGWGQLGFFDSREPLKLLTTMFRSYRVRVTGNTGASPKLRLEMDFFDIDMMRRATIHPAAGNLGLPGDRSWFDWVYSAQPLSEPAKFVKTGPTPGSRSSAIAGGSAGLMADKGNGLWTVPPRYRLDLEALVKRNEGKIVRVMENTIVKAMNRYLK